MFSVTDIWSQDQDCSTFKIYVAVSIEVDVSKNFLQISVSDLKPRQEEGKCEPLWHKLRLHLEETDRNQADTDWWSSAPAVPVVFSWLLWAQLCWSDHHRLCQTKNETKWTLNQAEVQMLLETSVHTIDSQ